jgi:hypothetical protein
LEENETMDADHSKLQTEKNVNGYKSGLLRTSKRIYIWWRLEIEVKYIEHPVPGYIRVGVVPSEVTPEQARLTTSYYPGNTFYGWKMVCCHEGIFI